jgi:hypothetical protein
LYLAPLLLHSTLWRQECGTTAARIRAAVELQGGLATLTFVKSFQLYWPKADPLPACVVKDYKADELEFCREQFRPVASGYRWHKRLFLLELAVFLGSIVCGFVFRMEWFFISGIVFHLVSF